MNSNTGAFSLPTWQLTRWLVDAGPDVPIDIRKDLVAGLFGTIPIFIGGVVNTVLVSSLITLRHPEGWFLAWLALEVVLCVTRAALLISARRAALSGQPTHTNIYVLLAVLWAASVGFGAFICITSGDWVAAMLACLSAGAMVGGICFRNFGAPRMTAIMIFLSLGPCCIATFFTDEPILWLICMQIPFYLLSMTMASYRLNRMLVSTMRAERENERRAKLDALTGLTNRFGLIQAIEAAIRDTESTGQGFAVLYLDLDGFKAVNDSYGHATGDALLCAVANRLLGLCPSSEGVAARLGGDEFVLLVPIAVIPDMQAFGALVVDRVAHGYDLGVGDTVQVEASIGIALYPEHGSDSESLLGAADHALYAAKHAGKARTALASHQRDMYRPFDRRGNNVDEATLL